MNSFINLDAFYHSRGKTASRNRRQLLQQIQRQGSDAKSKRRILNNAAPNIRTRPTSVPKQPQPITFPIDLVYTWVDGSDESWQASFYGTLQRQQEQQQQNSTLVDSILPCRWRNLNELQHAVASARAFAPWIRNIFIVTANQTPPWMTSPTYNASQNIHIISHQTLFAEYATDHLPTFNSHAIEAHLHRIPQLAEHFIYANDDTFFGAPCTPHDFFTPEGQFKVFLSPVSLPKTNPSKMPGINAYVMAQYNTYTLLRQTYGASYIKDLKRPLHQMKPLRRSVYEYCWNHEQLMLYLFNTSSHPFRDISDIDPVNLVSQVGLLHKSAVVGTITSKYYPVTDDRPVEPIFRHLREFKPTPKIYCINDDMKNPTPDKVAKLQAGLERWLPHQLFI